MPPPRDQLKPSRFLLEPPEARVLLNASVSAAAQPQTGQAETRPAVIAPAQPAQTFEHDGVFGDLAKLEPLVTQQPTLSRTSDSSQGSHLNSTRLAATQATQKADPT